MPASDFLEVSGSWGQGLWLRASVPKPSLHATYINEGFGECNVGFWRKTRVSGLKCCNSPLLVYSDLYTVYSTPISA